MTVPPARRNTRLARAGRRPSLLRPSKLAVWQLDDRIVPAGTVTGSVFRDFNADGVFDAGPRTVPNASGVGAVGASQDLPYTATPLTVRGFDRNNAPVGQATTTPAGTYTLNLSGTGPYRVEFGGLPAGYSFGPAAATGSGVGGAGTTIQFVGDGATSNVNLSLVRPEDLSADDPLLAATQFVFGGRDEANANLPVVRAFPYSSGAQTGDAVNGDPAGTRSGAYSQPTPGFGLTVTQGQVGSVWGLGYDRANRQVLMSAYTKRHSGYGPNGPGAIYSAPAPGAAGTTGLLVDLNAAVDLGGGGANPAGTTYRPANSPAFDPTRPQNDFYFTDGLANNQGWNSVGNTGLGGLDVSPDGRFAYTVALGNRRFFVIDLQTRAVRSYAIPVPAGVADGDFKPFAVTFHNGSVYVGAVSTGESLYGPTRPTLPAPGSADDIALQAARASMRGFVFRFDPAADPVAGGSGRFVDTAGVAATPATAVNFAFPLNYDRGYTHPGANRNTTADDLPAEWRPWSSVYRNVRADANQPNPESSYPQPMLSGLAFDTDGSLVVGLRDRAGDQFGVFTPVDPSRPDVLLYGFPGGDVLRAAPAGPTWTLESNGTVGGVTSGLPRGVTSATPGAATVSGVGNGQGPGGGEFYSGDYLVPSTAGVNNPGPQQEHQELFLGAVLQLPGAPNLVATAFDAGQSVNGFNTGGLRWLFNAGPNAGTLDKGYNLYIQDITSIPPPLFAKTNGVGDLVALIDNPLEIGNRVWRDLNENGLQDANEPGIGGVQVVLFSGSNPVATATTAADGSYLFSNRPGTTVGGRTFGVALRAGSSYQVHIPLAQAPLRGLQTTAFQANPAGLDPTIQLGQIQSDANTAGTDAVIDVAALGLIGANHTYDAGFSLIPTLNLGDFVWDDRNNNGLFDPTETGLAGVEVQLVGPAGVTATATTNGQGGYLFTGLLPGSYRVQIPAGQSALGGRLSSSGVNGQALGIYEPATGDPLNGGNNVDHGVRRGDYFIGPSVRLTIGAAPTGEVSVQPGGLGLDDVGIADVSSDRSQDFGFYLPLSLGDTVWLDANNDGVRQPAEAPLAGVTVQLVDAAGAVVDTTTTNPAGGYLFRYLAPGTYTVRLLRNGVLDGLVSSTPNEPPASNGNPPVNDRDAGVEQPGQSSGPSYVTSPAVLLAAGGAPAAALLTVPAGLPADPAPAGNQFRNVDFGLVRLLRLGDFVWQDTNNNGVLDQGEPPVAGVPVELLDGAGNPVLRNGAPLTGVTDSQGGYLFTGLLPGTYIVRIAAPAGFASSTGVNGSPTGPFEPAPLTLTNNRDNGTTVPGGRIQTAPIAVTSDNLQFDFGLIPLLSVGDLVWEDVNNDGLRQAGEAGIGGVVVTLTGLDPQNAGVLTATSAADGGYLFTTLVAGRYQVAVQTPAGFAGSTGRNGSLSGPFEPAPAGATNNQDHGTNGGGRAVGPVFNLQPGLAPTDDLDGPAVTDPAPNANSDRTQDFGFYRPLAAGDLVFRDNNRDGVFNGGDSGIAGVSVLLRDANGAVISTTTTNADGRYFFGDLASGNYSIQIVPPAGLINTVSAPSPQPANDQNRGVTQADGTIAATTFTLGLFGSAANPDGGFANFRQDFGLTVPPTVPPPPPPVVSSLGGTVYIDGNIDGIRQPGERGLADVRVLLDGVTTGGERVTRDQFTDGDGRYLFGGLPAGAYVVREQTPTGRLFNGAINPGSVGGLAGRDITTGINLPPAVAATNYDFGEVEPASTFGYVWVDSNSNGVRDAGELPLPGVPVTVGGTAFAGTRFARPLAAGDVPGGLTAVTGPNGRYDFPALPPGEFTLTETQPEDYFNSGEQNGDPYGPAVAISLNNFAGVTLGPTAIRGPFNFGERLSGQNNVPNRSPQVPVNPTKREFLSSTSTPARQGLVASDSGGDQDVQTVVPVARLNLQPDTGLRNRSGALAVTATGAGVGSSPVVRVFDNAAGVERFRFLAYEQSYTGGVQTAVGDVDGDGIPDVITAVAGGGGPRVRVFSGRDASVLQDFFAYEDTFTGGLTLAAGDVDGDGRADIVTGTNMGGGPRVRVFSGATGAVLQDYMAFDQDQRGGVRVATADFNRDGRADVAATTGMGVPTRVRVFDTATGAATLDFAPFEAGFTGGATIAAGDFNGDGVPDLILGADAGGGPRVSVFSGRDATALVSFFAFEPTFTGGVRVAAVDSNGDGTADIVAGAGTGGVGRVSVFSGPGLGKLQDFFATDADQPNGVFVGAGSVARRTPPAGGLPVSPGELNRAGALAELPADFARSVTT